MARARPRPSDGGSINAQTEKRDTEQRGVRAGGGESGHQPRHPLPPSRPSSSSSPSLQYSSSYDSSGPGGGRPRVVAAGAREPASRAPRSGMTRADVCRT